MIDENEVFEYLVHAPEGTQLYLGADSERYRDKNGMWYATYYLVFVIHIAGSKGCKIFAEAHKEPDYDKRANKPSMRLTTEAYKLAALYSRLEPAINASGFPAHIHLDISTDESHGSNCAASAAVGYIKGMCGIEPQLKPTAWAASYAADRGAEFVK